GADMQQDFLRYIITRHDPVDHSQVHVVSMLRHLFGDAVLTSTAVESAAIETAGLAKRTVYELESGNAYDATANRTRESIDAVNAEVLELIARSWGRQ